MKILFLDVDGVLNHNGMTAEQWTNGHLSMDPACVERVRGICDRTGARIVVSSTWRRSAEGMGILLEAFGERIIGVTPPGKLNGARRKEIEAWIIQHSAIPLVCVAVDDDDDCEGIGWKFVKTEGDFGEGLTVDVAAEIEAAFGAKEA